MPADDIVHERRRSIAEPVGPKPEEIEKQPPCQAGTTDDIVRMLGGMAPQRFHDPRMIPGIETLDRVHHLAAGAAQGVAGRRLRPRFGRRGGAGEGEEKERDEPEHRADHSTSRAGLLAGMIVEAPASVEAIVGSASGP